MRSSVLRGLIRKIGQNGFQDENLLTLQREVTDMSNLMMVGVDGSEPGVRAADLAAEEARAHGAKLAIVYVIEWSPYSFNTPEENEQRHKRREEEIDTANTKVLQPLIEKFSGTGVDVEGMVFHGHPAKTLNSIAIEKQASRIFIGRTGGSGISQLLFGSVAGNLVQTATVPVTVVP